MNGRIDILQWREPYDDEDNLSVFAYAPDQIEKYEDNCLTDIREMYQIGDPENEYAVDAPGCILLTNSRSLCDGAVITHKGRTFRLNITEVTHT